MENIHQFSATMNSINEFSHEDNSVKSLNYDNNLSSAQKKLNIDIDKGIRDLDNRGDLNAISAKSKLAKTEQILKLGTFLRAKANSQLSDYELVVRFHTKEKKQYGIKRGQKIFWLSLAIQDNNTAEDVAQKWINDGTVEDSASEITSTEDNDLVSAANLIFDLATGSGGQKSSRIQSQDTQNFFANPINSSPLSGALRQNLQHPITGIFTNAPGDISYLVRQDGKKIEVSAHDQLVELSNGRIGRISTHGEIEILDGQGNEIINVIRGPDNIEQEFVDLKTLAETGIWGSIFEDITPIEFLENNIEALNALGDVIVAVNIANRWGDPSFEAEAKNQLEQAIVKILGENENLNLNQIQSASSDGIDEELFDTITSIQDITAALRTAKQSGNKFAIQAFGKQFAENITNAVVQGYASVDPTLLSVTTTLLNVFSYFGGHPKQVEISDSLDITGDGTFDEVHFIRGRSDYRYDIKAGDRELKVDRLNFRLNKVPAPEVRSVSQVSKINEQNTSDRFFLNLNVRFESIFDGITGKAHLNLRMSPRRDEIKGTALELTKEQYNQLLLKYGERGSFSSQEGQNIYNDLQDMAHEQLEQHEVRFLQRRSAAGLNFFTDVNNDGTLDRVQQFIDLTTIDGPSYRGKPSFTVHFRNADGEELFKLSGGSLEDISQAAQLRPFTLMYIASHPDLIRQYGSDLNRNFLEATKSFLENGAQRGIIFDPSSYLLANPDLLEKLGNDKIAATEHFIKHGFRQGRADTLPSAQELFSHSVISDNPTNFLEMLLEYWPALEKIYKNVPFEKLNADFAVNLTHTLLSTAPQTTGPIVESLTKTSTLDNAPSLEIRTHQSPIRIFSKNTLSTNQMNNKQDIVLAIDTSGELALIDTDTDEVLWSSQSIKSGMPIQIQGQTEDIYNLGTSVVNGELLPNQYLVSENQKYFALFQSDGDFVVYEGQPNNIVQTIWRSQTAGIAEGGRISLQKDGNLVIARKNDAKAWSSKTGNIDADREFILHLENDGNLRLIDSQGYELLWSSHDGKIRNAADNITLWQSQLLIASLNTFLEKALNPKVC